MSVMTKEPGAIRDYSKEPDLLWESGKASLRQWHLSWQFKGEWKLHKTFDICKKRQLIWLSQKIQKVSLTLQKWTENGLGM